MARDLLQRSRGLSMEGAGFDALELPAERVSAEETVSVAAADHVQAGSMVLRLARDSSGAGQLIERCRGLVLEKAPEHPTHKYAVAAFEEFRVTHPRWSPYVLAPCLSYLPTTTGRP